MSLVKLICPHCGGPFQIDDSHDLQPRWLCPYCSQKSLLLRRDGEISLHGILSSDTHELADVQEEDAEKTEAVKTAEEKSPEKPAAGAASGQTPADDAIDAKQDDADRARELDEAARHRDLPCFNRLSRLMLDQNPEDPHVFAWRAILREQADGLARNCWAHPTWSHFTPRQQKQLLAQHSYALKSALMFQPDSQARLALAEQIADLLADQVIAFIDETARLRWQRKKTRKPFSGQYRKADLRTIPALLFVLGELEMILRQPYGKVIHKTVLVSLAEKAPVIMQKIRKYHALPDQET